MLFCSNDFFSGASAVVGALVIYKVWTLFQSPSPESIEAIAIKPLPHMGDDEKITLWGFEKEGEHRLWKSGVSDASPYVSRVEANLRLAGVEYVKEKANSPDANPRRKVPWANVKGEMVDDSSRILDVIKAKCNVTIDDELTMEQKNLGHLIRQMLFGSLYWVLTHQHFMSSIGRKHFYDDMANAIGLPIIPTLVSKMVFRTLTASLWGVGTGRMPQAEIDKMGEEDVRCLSRILHRKKFFLGENATSFDCDVYSWLVVLFNDESQTHRPWVRVTKKECKNLVDFTDRMRGLLYPELKTT